MIAKLIDERNIILRDTSQDRQQVFLSRRPPKHIACEHHEVGTFMPQHAVDNTQRHLRLTGTIVMDIGELNDLELTILTELQFLCRQGH